jgi:glycosyltransferase involved in cell wall biosynthesis
MVSFKRQYPQWLFPGKNDKDPSQTPLEVDDVRYWIDSINPMTWLRTFCRIRRYQPDLLILQWWVTYWTPLWFVFGLLNRLWLRVPLLFVCHNVLPHESKNPRLDGMLTRLTLRWGSVFIVQSDSERSRLKQVVDGKVSVVPHPVYDMFSQQLLQREDARAQLSLSENAPVLLFFGIVREYKGLEDLLEALPLVCEHHPDLRLLIAGEFWDDVNQYLSRIRRLGLENEIIIDNRYIPNEEMIRYFSAADVLVAPYRRVTGSGVVQLALGMGCPVITTEVVALVNYKLEGVRGRSVPPHSPKLLANVIIDYIERDLMLTRDSKPKWVDDSSWDKLLDAVEDTVSNRLRETG